MNEFEIHIDNYKHDSYYIKSIDENKNILINHFLEVNNIDNFNLLQLKLSHLDIFTMLNGRLFITTRYIECLQKIPGILLLDKTYGSFKDKFFYKLIPFNKSYPSFLISYNKPTSFNKHIIHKYILFKFKHWNNKHPHGEIIEILGDVNNIQAYSKYRLYCDNLFFSKKELNKQTNLICKNNQFFSLFQDKIINKDTFIFTIDPSNCTDFDDAVSINQLDDIITIKIYISNVAYILDVFQLYSYINHQISSIYLPDEVIHMLSTQLSKNICSLVEHTNKFCLVCNLTIQNNKIIHTKFTSEIIHIHKNFIYDEKELISNKDYQLLLDTVSKFTPIENSHDVIEWLAIEMNYRASLLLKQHKIGIFRNNIDMKSQYFLYDETNHILPFKHEALEKPSYVHITSPIRRIVDVLNQISLIYILELHPLHQQSIDFYNNYKSNIPDINLYSKKIKYLESDIYFLHAIKDISPPIYKATVLEHSLYIEELHKYLYYKDIHLIKHINTIITIQLFLITEEITLQNKIKINILEN